MNIRSPCSITSILKTFAVTVNAEGDTSGADEVDKRISKLDGKKCSVTFTADGTPDGTRPFHVGRGIISV